MELVYLFVALSVGNFLYAFITSNGYESAFERSFFQGVALTCVGLVL